MKPRLTVVLTTDMTAGRKYAEYYGDFFVPKPLTEQNAFFALKVAVQSAGTGGVVAVSHDMTAPWAKIIRDLEDFSYVSVVDLLHYHEG